MPSDHIHQGRFAAAVFAQQGQYLAAAHAQRDILVGHDSAKGLGNVPKRTAYSFCAIMQAPFGWYL